jgi:hypothetical protein
MEPNRVFVVLAGLFEFLFYHEGPTSAGSGQVSTQSLVVF